MADDDHGLTLWRRLASAQEAAKASSAQNLEDAAAKEHPQEEVALQLQMLLLGSNPNEFEMDRGDLPVFSMSAVLAPDLNRLEPVLNKVKTLVSVGLASPAFLSLLCCRRASLHKVQIHGFHEKV